MPAPRCLPPSARTATGRRRYSRPAYGVRRKAPRQSRFDCIGFTERHRDTLAALDMPVILSNAVVAKAVGELFGG